MSDSPARVLVVEDEENLARGIAENLEAEGYRVELSGDGPTALARILAGDLDLVLLDVMLPEMDGYTVCERARSAGSEVPILFLTARASVEDRIRGLSKGGDDYLPKPFHLEELLLRVAAILRRSGGDSTGGEDRSVAFGGNAFDFRTWRGRSWDGADQELTQKEAMILKTLSARDGEVVSREEILEEVWGHELFPSTRTIDNFIVRLRKRFERDPEQPRHFHTVRGVGYRFTGEASPESPEETP